MIERDQTTDNIIDSKLHDQLFLPGFLHSAIPFGETVLIGEQNTRFREQIGAETLKSIDLGVRPIPKRYQSRFEAYRKRSNRLAEANIPLVFFVMKRRGVFYNLNEHEIDEISGSLLERLVLCARRYNPWHGLDKDRIKDKLTQPIAFSSYAVKSLDKTIIRSLREQSSMSISQGAMDRYSRFKKAKTYMIERDETVNTENVIVSAQMMRSRSSVPTLEELKEYYQLLPSNPRKERAHRELVRDHYRLISALKVQSISQTFTSKRQIRDESGELSQISTSLDQVLTSSESVEEEVIKNDLKRELDKALERLPDKQARVLRMRYLDELELTLNQVAARMSLSRERVRQLVAEAFSNIRSPSNRRELREYLFD